MMMIKKYMTVIFVASLQLMAGAQSKGLYNGNLNENSNRLQGKLMGEIYYLTPVSNANYFLQQEWTEGKITLKGGDKFEGVKMRYMAYGDELVAYNSNLHSLFIVDKNTVKEFAFQEQVTGNVIIERKFVNLDSLDIPFNKSYFEELYSGTAKLLSFHQIEEQKVSPYTDQNGKMYDAEFHLRTTYYILSDLKGCSKIQLRRRSLYSFYPENKKEIKKILRKNKINFTNEYSAIQTLKLLDSVGLFK